MSDWICVNDRLPEYGQRVLAYGRCKVDGRNVKEEMICEFIKPSLLQNFDPLIPYEKIGVFGEISSGYFWAAVIEKWKPIDREYIDTHFVNVGMSKEMIKDFSVYKDK